MALPLSSRRVKSSYFCCLPWGTVRQPPPLLCTSNAQILEEIQATQGFGHHRPAKLVNIQLNHTGLGWAKSGQDCSQRKKRGEFKGNSKEVRGYGTQWGDRGWGGKGICHSAPLHTTCTFPTPPLTDENLTLLIREPKTLLNNFSQPRLSF